LLLIIKVTKFVRNPIEDGIVEPKKLFPIRRVPNDEYWPTEVGISYCKLLLDKSNVTSFVRDEVNVKKPPVNLLLFKISELREDSDDNCGRVPPTEPPLIVRAVKVDSWPMDAGSVPPLILTPVTEILTTADAEHVT